MALPAQFGVDFARSADTQFSVHGLDLLTQPSVANRACSVFRATEGTLDHTAVLATIEKRSAIDPVTWRDAAAPDLGAVLSLTQATADRSQE